MPKKSNNAPPAVPSAPGAGKIDPHRWAGGHDLDVAPVFRSLSHIKLIGGNGQRRISLEIDHDGAVAGISVSPSLTIAEVLETLRVEWWKKQDN